MPATTAWSRHGIIPFLKDHEAILCGPAGLEVLRGATMNCHSRSFVCANVARNGMRLAAGGVLFLTAAAIAQTANIVGLGAATCKEFTGDVERNFQIQRDYFAWAQGYMSGILMRAPAGQDEGLELNPPRFSLSMQVEFLRSFCDKNPEKDYSDGVAELYRRLRSEQSR
jgi:hypothetical protein